MVTVNISDKVEWNAQTKVPILISNVCTVVHDTNQSLLVCEIMGLNEAPNYFSYTLLSSVDPLHFIT